MRMATIEAAGQDGIPFTTGILLGIGETRRERVEALLAIKHLNDKYGHIQVRKLAYLCSHCSLVCVCELLPFCGKPPFVSCKLLLLCTSRGERPPTPAGS